MTTGSPTGYFFGFEFWLELWRREFEIIEKTGDENKGREGEGQIILNIILIVTL